MGVVDHVVVHYKSVPPKCRNRFLYYFGVKPLGGMFCGRRSEFVFSHSLNLITIIGGDQFSGNLEPRECNRHIAGVTDDSFLATYERDGYSIQRGILAAADLDLVREFVAAEVEAYARRMLAEGKICSLHAEQPFAAICRARRWCNSAR